ncbi:MAG: ester cyclase [Saprospiraceae bacterium]|nr:ester cyclase [Candidatus Vicinibacter proximus]MBL7821963.1 ester cyclase [Saprospiraceae bacterium]MCC6841533.1 ester cyclase [Saprospiraceae bacterium]HRG33502.1 ester cyclase [Saprospiraceae bacterium]
MDKLNTVKNTVDQLLGQGNFDIVDSVFSVNYVAHSGDKSYNGHKFIKQFAKQVRTALPNIKILNIELLSQTDNVLTWQRTFSGTHKADLMGIPASNKKVKWYEIVVSRFDKDKIVEEWLVSDLAFQLILKQDK